VSPAPESRAAPFTRSVDRMDRSTLTSYRRAEEIARSRARNFYYSFLVLPREKRRAMCAVYAFMRACDDIADGPDAVDEKRTQLTAWRSTLDGLACGRRPDSHLFLPAFVHTVARFSIPWKYFHWIIDGVEMDLTARQFPTFDDLYRYCFHVASSVGLVCLQIFGYSDEKAREFAEHCGIAFQLTNILRDVQEDARMGRMYFPLEDLEKFGCSAEALGRGVVDGDFGRLMAFEAERAEEYYRQGARLIPLIEKSGRPALWAMIEIYHQILHKIVRNQFDVFGPAIRLSSAEKAAIAARALMMRVLPWDRTAA
jgi:phytoene synthase